MSEDAKHLSEEQIVALVEKLRAEQPPAPLNSVSGVFKMIALIAGAVVSLGGAVTYGVNSWTSLGWVTRHEFTQVVDDDKMNFVNRMQYDADLAVRDARNDRQDAEIKAAQSTGSEILAFVKIVPQLKVMIRIRCTGNNGVQPTIDELKAQFKDLTKRDYKEPGCNDPELKSP